MEDKIKLQEISKKYKTFFMENMSFSIKKGYITGLIGPNGAGKTTLIKAIMGMIHIDAGKIYYDGTGTQGEDAAYCQDIGLVMDAPMFCKDWTMDALSKAMRLGYAAWDETMFFSYLERFSIDRKLKVKELSKGMGVKLMLAAALSHGAKTLVLDEPTSGFDPSMRDSFIDMLQEFAQDEAHSVLFSTHITQDLEAVADYIVFVQDGKKIFEGSKDSFLERFLLIKGDSADFEKINKESIIGAKKNMSHFEALIEKEKKNSIGVPIETQMPSIEKIMVYFRRGQ